MASEMTSKTEEQKFFHTLSEQIKELIANANESEEDKHGDLTMDDIRKLLVILSFLTFEFLSKQENTFDIWDFPEYTIPAEFYHTDPVEAYIESVPKKIGELLDLIKSEILKMEMHEELSNTLLEHIVKKSTVFFHENYKHSQCFVFNHEDKTLENMNYVVVLQTQFRLLLCALLEICQI